MAKLIRFVYRMVRYGTPFIDRGAEFYDAQHRKLQINYLKRSRQPRTPNHRSSGSVISGETDRRVRAVEPRIYCPSPPGTRKSTPRSSLALVVAGISRSAREILCVRCGANTDSVVPVMA